MTTATAASITEAGYESEDFALPDDYDESGDISVAGGASTSPALHRPAAAAAATAGPAGNGGAQPTDAGSSAPGHPAGAAVAARPTPEAPFVYMLFGTDFDSVVLGMLHSRPTHPIFVVQREKSFRSRGGKGRGKNSGGGGDVFAQLSGGRETRYLVYNMERMRRFIARHVYPSLRNPVETYVL